MDSRPSEDKLLNRFPDLFKSIFTRTFFLLLIVFGVNLLLRKNSRTPNAYASYLNYNQLYFDKDRLHIRQTRLVQDSLELELDGEELKEEKNRFSICLNGNWLPDQERSGKKIRIRPGFAGIHSVKLIVNGSPDTISFHYDNHPDSLSVKLFKNTVYELTSNTPVAPEHLLGYKSWAIRSWGQESEEIKEESSQMVKDSMHLEAGDGSRERILKIAAFILKKTAGHEGEPSMQLSSLHPLGQLRSVESGSSRIWCGNFTSIFSYFASAAGLPVRLVSCGRAEGQYLNGIHYFCEVYLKEEKVWAYVDLTSRNILTRYGQKWLNAVDIQRLLAYGIRDSSWRTWHYEKDSLYEMPFYEVADLAAYYFHSNNRFCFYYGDYLKIMSPKNPLDRLKKFFYPSPYYAVYSDSLYMPNEFFYLRLISNYLFAVLLVVYLYSIFRKLVPGKPGRPNGKPS